MTSMYVGKKGDPGAESKLLSSEDCEDSDACLRSGIRGPRDSAANWGKGDITYEIVPDAQPSGKWRAMGLQHTSGVLNPNESSVDTSQRGLESIGLSKPPAAGTEVGMSATTGGKTATTSSNTTTFAPG